MSLVWSGILDVEHRVHEKTMLYGLPEAILFFSEDERRYYERHVQEIVYPKRRD